MARGIRVVVDREDEEEGWVPGVEDGGREMWKGRRMGRERGRSCCS